MRTVPLAAALAAAVFIVWGISPIAEAGPRSLRVEAGVVAGGIQDSGLLLRLKGKRDRKQARLALWVAGLAGDRASVYAAKGHPTFRHFENFAGERTEVWIYPRYGKRYVFSGDTLVQASRYTSVQFSTRRNSPVR